MLRQLNKLINEPAFREAPLTVLGRAVALAASVTLGRRPQFELVQGGAKLRVPADFRYTTLATYLLRDTLEPELHYIQKFIRPGDVFVDVGANIGLFSLKVSPLAGRVVAVEPGVAASTLLAENIALNGFSNVTIVRKALSDAEGKAVLHHNPLGDDPQAFSLINDGRSVEGEQVEITTLDVLSRDLALPRVDIIKIDVEGAESMVLAGGQEVLATSKPVVIFEINCPTLFEGGGDPAAAWNALDALGYTFFEFEEDGALTPLATRPTAFGNVVAVHPQGRQVS